VWPYTVYRKETPPPTRKPHQEADFEEELAFIATLYFIFAKIQSPHPSPFFIPTLRAIKLKNDHPLT
jgi:hypothetical protein